MIASSNFLVPNATLIVEVVAFLIVLGVIGKYVLPVLNRALEERQDEIRSSLEAAAIIEEARQHAREIVAQANRTAQRVAAEAEERGQREHDRIVSSAESEITLARQRAVEEVSAQVATLVLAVARQVIGREIDPATHRDLIDEAVEVLRSSAQSSPAGTQS